MTTTITGGGGGGGYVAGDGITLSGLTITNSAKPAPLVTTRTVEIITGHVGQVIYQSRIIWQSKARKNAPRALGEADRHVSNRVTKLFAR